MANSYTNVSVQTPVADELKRLKVSLSDHLYNSDTRLSVSMFISLMIEVFQKHTPTDSEMREHFFQKKFKPRGRPRKKNPGYNPLCDAHNNFDEDWERHDRTPKWDW